MQNENNELAPVELEAVDGVTMTSPIWEQQHILGERDADYAEFLHFANMHPKDRSVKGSWQSWTNKSTTPSLAYEETAKRFKWQVRASARDVHLLKIAADDWVSRDQKRRDADFKIADEFRRLAREKLNEMTTDDVSANTAARFAELASKLQADAVPQSALNAQEVKDVINALPEDRRKNIIAVLVGNARK